MRVIVMSVFLPSSVFLAVIMALGLGGCATRSLPDPAYYEMEAGLLPAADRTLEIPGLGPCTDSPDRRLRLSSGHPVNVLVHGCFGSSGEFRGLAQVLAFQGQQAACFTYDDRAALGKSASALRDALGRLAGEGGVPAITLIGHSQGALIARRAMTAQAAPLPSTQLDLVTISGPFAGIAAAKPCGFDWMHVLSLGLTKASCHLVTGAKWADITYSSRFIREPGKLADGVGRYLKIDTDERDTCRRREDRRCVESDLIFSLDEQRQPLVDGDPRTRTVQVAAGHVEIVGDKRVAPVKLLDVFQQEGVLRPVSAARLPAYRALLARIYQDASLAP